MSGNASPLPQAGKIKRALTGLKDHLTRQINKYHDLSQQIPIIYLELESYFQIANNKFEQIRVQITQYLSELAETQITDTELDDIMSELAQFKDDVQVKLQSFNKLITQNKVTTASTKLLQPKVKLPCISLPTFSGNENESWDDFWNKFADAADSKPTLPKTTKFTYLQAQLKGEALKVISNLNLTSDGYDLAVHLLKSNYANTKRAVTNLVQKLLDLPATDSSTDSPQTFRLELESLLMALSLKVNLKAAEWLTKVIVRCKLPSETLDIER
ncbi:uncharacterized protein [Procambarus clarkii]|uniref:uncharacterized protein n=1 Tax=Procambarus clarkii TaxID=6728 RepID=UPI001E674B81|nr:uncharacterized protein LOC123761521 [Procambarus clarkii]